MTRPRRRRSHPVLAALDPDAGPDQEAIVAELRRTLVDGGAPPGSELPVDEIAVVFGVSRVPIREALKTLQGEGLVEHLPRRGYTVARLTREEYVDLYIARNALEVAALHRALTLLSEGEIEALAGVHARLGSALAAGDAAGWHRGSRTFHEILVAPSQMHQLLRLLESTWNVTEPLQPMTLLPPGVLRQLQNEHEEILQACRQHRAETVLSRFERHGRHLIDVIGSLPADHAVFAPPRGR